MMKISAFGDEIASDLEQQLQTLQQLDIPLLDLRTAWGINCAQLNAEHIQRIRQLCQDAGITVACMGSPIGKSPISDPIARECERLKTIGDCARQLGTDKIRIFSFYPSGAPNAAAVQAAIDRLQQLVCLAQSLDLQLLLENEKGIVGDLPERCLQILQAVDSPRLRFIWDPANFVQCGVAAQVERYWDALSPYIGYVHIKDAQLPAANEARSTLSLAGTGDGQLPELLLQLRDSGYRGILSLEPHLLDARHSSGFSGAEGMAQAAAALRELMDASGIPESETV